MNDFLDSTAELSNEELDQKLEDAVIQNMESEKLICCYLTALRERGGYRDFGFSNIYDYADQRFGYSHRKTRWLITLGRKLVALPKIREALKDGKIGWVKASLLASKATKEDEAMWLDSALSLTVRELEKRIKDGTDSLASTIHFWMGADQRATWENALEICRRVAGAELSPGEALEYIAGEFIATYGHLLRDEEPEPTEEDGKRLPNDDASAVDELAQERMCPADDKELPPPVNVKYDEFTKRIFERDSYRCKYPGCSARAQLHCHHIRFRSRGGKHVASNCITICAFHHRMLHGGVIGLSGSAPDALEWRPPKLMARALERRGRNKFDPGELDVKTWTPLDGKRLPDSEAAVVT